MIALDLSPFLIPAIQISGFFIWLIYIPWIKILWHVMKQNAILSKVPVYPQAKIIDKKISKKLGDERCIIVCESYFVRKDNNPHGIYGKVERHSIFVALKDYNNLSIDQIVFLVPRDIYVSESVEGGCVYHYSIITSQEEYENYSKFWNTERFIALSS